jgi:RND family efflux transporter MFP subunit
MLYRSFARIVFIPFLLALIAAGCSEKSGGQMGGSGEGGRGAGRGGAGRGGPRGGAGNLPAVRVKTVRVERVTFQRQVELSGTLISIEQARVSSEVPGVVKDVLVDLGSEVAAGQPLIRIDTRELELARQRAESSLRQTEAQLGIDANTGRVTPEDQIAAVRSAMVNREDARTQHARAQELGKRGLLSKADFDTTETRVKVTDAAYQAALENVRSLKASLQDRRAAYELAVKKIQDAVVRAPIAGAVSDRPVQRGEYIRENTVVATIVQTNPLKIVSAVQEKYSNVIQHNQKVQFSVESLPDQKLEGRVASISPAVDQTTRTFAVEILVDNSSRRLKPGFFAKGVILTERDDNVIAVADSAVITAAGVSSVFVVKDGMVKQQNIRLGAREGDRLEILEGLKGDETLAASNLNELVSGITVAADKDPEAGLEKISTGAPTSQAPAVNAPGRGSRRGGAGGS